ncbi:MAG: hypothetical protein WBV73_14520 [Phormidium sp.]
MAIATAINLEMACFIDVKTFEVVKWFEELIDAVQGKFLKGDRFIPGKSSLIFNNKSIYLRED